MSDNQKGGLHFWLIILICLVIGAIIGVYQLVSKKSQPGNNQTVTNAPSNNSAGLKYCNTRERYCFSHPADWSITENEQQISDDKGKIAITTPVTVTSPAGFTIKITPQFGGGPGGEKCFTERIQFNPDSECQRQTYLSAKDVTDLNLCEDAKTPQIIHKKIYNLSNPEPRYQLRFGVMREHDSFSVPVKMGQEFLSNGYDYDNVVTHCGRRDEDQPRFPSIRFDIPAQSASESFYQEPTTLHAESILESFRFQ